MNAITPAYEGYSSSLWDGEVVEESQWGSIRRVTADTFPVLCKMSLARVILEPEAARAPHWYANASELAYCVSGTIVVSVLERGGSFASFVVEAGASFYVESGSLHYVDNVGDDRAEFIAAFHNEHPEEFGLGDALEQFGDEALEGTYNLSPADADRIRRRVSSHRLTPRIVEPGDPSAVRPGNRRGGGERPRPARHDADENSSREPFRPVLKDMSMYAAPVSDEELRGPHWHPLTAEMGYSRAGGARLSIMMPGGDLDTEDIVAGDVYFVPSGYPHRIEKTEDDGQLLTFFDRPAPPRSDTAHRPVPLRAGSLPQRGRQPH